MFEKSLVESTMDKFKKGFEENMQNQNIQKYIHDLTRLLIYESRSNSDQNTTVDNLIMYTEKLKKFMRSFLKELYVPLELFADNIQFYFSFLSILLERIDMSAKEKECIIFEFICNTIENDFSRKDFLSIISEEMLLQYLIIYEFYLKKIINDDIINFEDLLDLKFGLLNLGISRKIVCEIIDDINANLNVCSDLESHDNNNLSPSMKKINDVVLEYSSKLIKGGFSFVEEDTILDKVYMHRRDYAIRCNLYLLNTIILSDAVFVDFNVLSNILSLFRTEFKLKQVDFVNIIFEIIERNISMGILEDCYVVYPVSKIPKEIMEEKNKFFTEVDDLFVAEISEEFDLKDEFLKVSNFIKHLHTILIDSYFNKKQNDGSIKDFSLSDLNNIKYALNGLEVNEYVIDVIVKYLRNKVTGSKSTIFDRVEKEKLSSDEYKKCMGKLKSYIQFDETLPNDEMISNSMLILRKITVKDKYICVDLMEKLGFSDKVILEFLIKAEKDNLFSSNIIAVYEIEVKNWLNFYREYDEYRDRICDIEETYKELCACYVAYYKRKESNSYALYQEWCKFLKDEIEDFYLIIDSAQRRNTSLLKRIKGKKENK